MQLPQLIFLVQDLCQGFQQTKDLSIECFKMIQPYTLYQKDFVFNLSARCALEPSTNQQHSAKSSNADDLCGNKSRRTLFTFLPENGFQWVARCRACYQYRLTFDGFHRRNLTNMWRSCKERYTNVTVNTES